MNRDEIKATIQKNLEEAGLHDSDVHIQTDPYYGWRIAVISDGFRDKELEERRTIALKGLSGINVEWDEYLTSQEKEWFGEPFADSDAEDLPLWPEALARGQQKKKR